MSSRVKTELAFAFLQMHKCHLKLVPKSLLEEIKTGLDKKLYKSFDKDKPFTKQNFSEETLEILVDIFKDLKK